MYTLLLWLLLAPASGTAPELGAWARSLIVEDAPHPEVARTYQLVGPMLAELAEAAERKPGAVRVESIGRTLGGQPIWAFHVTEPGVPVERKVLVFAGIHALEWISSEVAAALLTELIELPPRGVMVTVVPMLNVDGRLVVEADLLAGQNQYRRGNGAMVDLNRDFAENREPVAVWRHVIGGYYASSPAPLSQPESRALDALADRERYDRAASVHAFGGYHYYPWAGRYRRPADWAEFVELGRDMEKAQAGGAYRTRQLSRWGFFFRAQGAEIDHLYGRYGTKAFLIEMTRSGFDIRRPAHSIKTYFRWYNPAKSTRHTERGVAALRALVRAEDAGTETGPHHR